MVEVNLWAGLRKHTGGEEKVEIEGKNIGQLLDNLVRDYPELEPFIEAGVSVAIDGRIMARDLTAEIKPDSEVYLLQQLKGG